MPAHDPMPYPGANIYDPRVQQSYTQHGAQSPFDPRLTEAQNIAAGNSSNSNHSTMQGRQDLRLQGTNAVDTVMDSLGLENAAKATAHMQDYAGSPGGAYAEAQRASQLGAQRSNYTDLFGTELRGRASQDYQNQQAARASQMGALGNLQQFYQQGPGPSAAQAQLAQASDQNMGQAMALAHSGRGAGDNAAAMRNAAFQNAATGQQTAGQMAGLRAQEDANWRGQQLNAMGMQQQGLAGVRAGDAGVYGGNTQGAFGYGQLANQQFQSGEDTRNKIFTSQLGSDTSMANAQTQADMQNQTAENQKHKDNIGFVGSILGGLSDEREKKNVQPYGLDEDLDPWGRKNGASPKAAAPSDSGGMMSGILGGLKNYGGGLMSDVRNKTNVTPSTLRDVFGSQPTEQLDAGYARQGQDVGPRFDLRPAQGYAYDYKDPSVPGAAPGRHFGPMAQDLEKTPAGASTVTMGPDGRKRVDAGRLTMVNTAALSDQQREIDRLKALLDGGQAQQAMDVGPRYAMGRR